MVQRCRGVDAVQFARVLDPTPLAEPERAKNCTHKKRAGNVQKIARIKSGQGTCKKLRAFRPSKRRVQ